MPPEGVRGRRDFDLANSGRFADGPSYLSAHFALSVSVSRAVRDTCDLGKSLTLVSGARVPTPGGFANPPLVVAITHADAAFMSSSQRKRRAANRFRALSR